MAIYAGLSLLQVFDVVQSSGPSIPWTESETLTMEETSYLAMAFAQWPEGQPDQELIYTLTVKSGMQIEAFSFLQLFCIAGTSFQFSVNGAPLSNYGPGYVTVTISEFPVQFNLVPTVFHDYVALCLNPEARLIPVSPSACWTHYLRTVESQS